MNEATPMDTELFQALFRTAPDAMIVVDRRGTIVLANPQADRLFGYPGDSLRGRPIEDLLPASVREVHVAHRTSYMTNPRVRPMGAGYELTGVRADGTPFPVEIGLSPVSGDGSLFAASIRDISETQRARQALARAHYDASLADISRRILIAANHEAAMAEIPAIIASTLAVPAAAVLLPDLHGRSFRVAAAQGVHRPLRDALADGEWLRELLPQLRFTAEEGAIVRANISIPLPGPRGDSQPADAILAPLPDREGPSGYIVVMVPRGDAVDRDRQHYVSSIANMLAAAIQRGRSEEQLAHAQRLDALGQLTGGIAHDFNNLLTIVSGNLQLLEIDLPEDPVVRESMSSASRAVERGSALTRKLLAFSRRQRLNPQRVRSELLLADLNDMLGRTLGERIRVVAECPDGLPPVFADPGELEAAIVNLALNARDAMPRGGKLSIAARLHEQPQDDDDLPKGTYVVYSVIDTGDGMHPDVLARALEPFFTTKGPGKGSGLGLSMVYGFVKQSRGRLVIESQLDKGTHVGIYLPVARGRDTPAVAPTGALRGNETVLVVEDEAEVRRVAVAFLRGLGYRVIEAESAASAQAAFERNADIDAVFTDVVLGDGDSGFDLADRLRALRPSLKIMMASGYEYGSSEDDLSRLDGRQLLRKPYRREQLAAALRALLDGDA
ncbi:PAS domain S-box protein [Luteibacter aegosomatis]|uniref:PAS domain S-box protein n=1 Tax=Luteibacter aegosomatis TaxID=2911537 RepID=UPI001FF992FF|nr:PAS domain S-box protein [Luteibacter aegosomatis]UPG86672.1 PAS domain S-box protein [Luteibacter aegosomatis]